MKVVRKSPFSGKINEREIEITDAQMIELTNPNRRNIQDILPDTSADDREFIMTGITPEEWKEAFGGAEE